MTQRLEPVQSMSRAPKSACQQFKLESRLWVKGVVFSYEGDSPRSLEALVPFQLFGTKPAYQRQAFMLWKIEV